MKYEHFRVMCAAAGTALVLTLAATGATAGQKQSTPVATIIGHRESDGALSVRVSYRDLNLASLSGEQMLNRRVRVAARFVCEPNHVYVPGDIGYAECLDTAWTGARPQIAAAVRRAREIALTGTSNIPLVAIAISVR
jgi:UrcA family protein